jgi:MtN3 and saliva related transmembrane protein
MIDILFLITVIVLSAGFIPQIIKTIRTKNTSSFSWTTLIINVICLLSFSILFFITKNYLTSVAEILQSILYLIIIFIKIKEDFNK